MKIVKGFMVTLVTFTLLIRCDGDNISDCFKKTGEIKYKEVQLSHFEVIEVMDEIDLYLISSSNQKVMIKAGENLIPKITLEVEDQVLTITNENTCNWKRASDNPDVYVYSNNITHLSIIDFANIYTQDTLKQQKLSIYTDGTGNFEMNVVMDTLLIESTYISNFHITGETDYLYLLLTNDSQFYGRNLIGNYCEVVHNGSNKIETFPVKSLTGKLMGTGSLYYYNDPEHLDVVVSGTGKLLYSSN